MRAPIRIKKRFHPHGHGIFKPGDEKLVVHRVGVH